jgi:plasmid stability protein
MATLTIKNIPEPVYEALKLRARGNRRSINSEVIVLIEQAVGLGPLPVADILAETRLLREKTAHYQATDSEIEGWINEGRE